MLSYANLFAAKFNDFMPAKEDFALFYANDKRLEDTFTQIFDQNTSLKEQLATEYDLDHHEIDTYIKTCQSSVHSDPEKC